MYRVIKNFSDLRDSGYRYKVGDVFPRPGIVISEERLSELLSFKNRQKMPLIEKIDNSIEEKISENVVGKRSSRRKNS